MAVQKQGEGQSLFVSLGDKCPLTQSQRLQYLIIYNSFGIIRFLRELKMARSSIIVYDILTIACNNKIKGQFFLSSVHLLVNRIQVWLIHKNFNGSFILCSNLLMRQNRRPTELRTEAGHIPLTYECHGRSINQSIIQ